MRTIGWSLALALLGALPGCGVTPEPVVSSLPAQGFAAAAAEDGDKAAFDAGRSVIIIREFDAGSNTCAARSFETRRVVPDVMILIDRSASMQSGSIDRWTPAVRAIKAVTASFDQGASFGLMLFPALTSDCAPGVLDVAPATGNASTISRKLASTAPFGATPTGETLQAALEVFRQRKAATLGAPQPGYVLLVTDGAPSCPNAQGEVGLSDALDADKQLALSAIDALHTEGIQTYVLGFNALEDLRFSGALTEFAQHGGTDHYYLISDEASLLGALDSIAVAVVSCSFDFDTDVSDPTLVHVTLNGTTLRPGDADGWSIQGRTVTVHGDACTVLQSGEAQKIELTLECAPVVYL